MNPQARKILRLLQANTRALASTIAVLAMMGTLIAVRHVAPVQDRPAAVDQPNGLPSADGTPSDGVTPSGVPNTVGPGGVPIPTVGGGPTGIGSPLPPPDVLRRALKGIDFRNKKIRIAFYWNDSSQNSQFLRGSGQEGNLDDGLAFEVLIRYINKYRNGGATFMGIPFNLHGFEIEGYEFDKVGKDQSNFDYVAAQIINEVKPVAALSARSSPSAYLCPALAKAGIYNFGTYDFYLKPHLDDRFDGKCRALAMSFAKQVDLTVEYLKWHQANIPNTNPTLPGPRTYGFAYASYKGLIESAPVVVNRLRAAGVRIPSNAVAKVSTSLQDAQQEMTDVIDRFKSAGVNTVVMPDAGVALNFTAAATANNYFPDYYVWPCSGQDSTGFVRLLGAQWARASGLTCYDDTFDADLTNDDQSRQTEWYKKFQEIDSRSEPPAPTPLVYAQLAPLLAGLSAAGPNMDAALFQRGLDTFTSYRYSGLSGRTTEPDNITVDFSITDGSIWADVAKVTWSATQTRPGGANGAYYYPENRRYRVGDRF